MFMCSIICDKYSILRPIYFILKVYGYMTMIFHVCKENNFRDFLLLPWVTKSFKKGSSLNSRVTFKAKIKVGCS